MKLSKIIQLLQQELTRSGDIETFLEDEYGSEFDINHVYTFKYGPPESKSSIVYITEKEP